MDWSYQRGGEGDGVDKDPRRASPQALHAKSKWEPWQQIHSHPASPPATDPMYQSKSTAPTYTTWGEMGRLLSPSLSFSLVILMICPVPPCSVAALVAKKKDQSMKMTKRSKARKIEHAFPTQSTAQQKASDKAWYHRV